MVKFRRWRDRLEILLDCRPRKQFLEHFSHHLAEFQYQQFDEVEIPGQYFCLRDTPKTFIKIDRFEPTINVARGFFGCHRSIVIRGHDGSTHRFKVQHPSAKQCRREERILQLYRFLNDILGRRKETRQRNIAFHVPIIVPLGPQIRLVEDDVSYISFQDIYEAHCQKNGFNKDAPIIYFIQRLREAYMNDSSLDVLTFIMTENRHCEY